MANAFQQFRHWNILSKKHCEKTSYIVALGLIATLYSTYLWYNGNWVYPIEYFYLAIFALLGGYLGVIFYKVRNHKPLKPKTLILFWMDR